MKEVWKDIKGYEGNYKISNFGRIESVRYGRILKQTVNHKGYKYVSISYNKKVSTYRVHRLVAIAFIDNKENKPQVNHINGIKTDNITDNLEWMTSEENVKHAVRCGLIKSELSSIEVISIRALHKECGYTKQRLSDMFRVSSNTIRSIIDFKTWKYI